MRKLVDPTAATGSGSRLSLPAPVGGWNARDPLAAMPPTDAIYLDNWFPTLGEVKLRPGCVSYAELPTGPIRSLFSCQLKTGDTKKFAVTNTGVYDITAGSTNTLAHALTNGYVETQNINVAGINYLWCCNGADKSFIYRNDTDIFQDLDATSTPALTGIDSTKVTNVYMWQNRILLCEKDSLKWYYLPLNSVGGAAAAFDMGAAFTRGGYIVCHTSWSVDSGSGPQDRLVVISSEGEIAIFSGTDPSSLDAFTRVGIYYLGRPLGKRCVVQLPGDVGILTESGLWPLSKVLASSTVQLQAALSDKIRNAFVSFAQSFGQQTGWQPVVYHGGQALLVNTPLSDSVSYQFVMNLSTKAWCRFTNWSATCFAVMDGNLYFANGRMVYQAWTGRKDRAGPIQSRVKQAFVYPSKRNISHVKLCRPILTMDKSVTVAFGLDTDFSDLTDFSSTTSYLQQISKWDEAVWDTATWSSSLTLKQWKTVNNTPGGAFAFRMQLQSIDVSVSWTATDFISQAGGIFG